MMMIKEALSKNSVDGTHLSENEMVAVMEQVSEGQATPVQIGALLVALGIKGREHRRDHRRGPGPAP